MDGQSVVNEIAFSQPVINIGADGGNDIVLAGARVADFHVMLNYAADQWHLIPLDPSYTSVLNGRGIGPEGCIVQSGSVLTIGDYHLTLSLNGVNADILVAQSLSLNAEGSAGMQEPQGKNILLSLAEGSPYEVETGSSVEYQLTVTNAGPLVANIQVQLQGVPAAWVQIIPPVLNLNEARRGTFSVRVSPPRDPSSTAGEYHLHFVAISPNYPGETGTADTTLIVLPFREFMVAGPNPRRLNLSRSQKEDFSDVTIMNRSNTETLYMIRSFDDGNDLTYAYKLGDSSMIQGQETVSVNPGEAVRVPVQVGARKTPLFGFSSKLHHYYTTVTPADSAMDVQSVLGEVNVRPQINGIWLIICIILVLLIAGFILQPYIYEFSGGSGKRTEVIIAGESLTVEWRVSAFAGTVTLYEGDDIKKVDKEGTEVLTPKTSTNYRLKSENFLSQLLGISYEKEFSLLLIPRRPSVNMFETDIHKAYYQQPVNLKWAVSDNTQTAQVVINKQKTDLTPDKFNGNLQSGYESDTLFWVRASNQSGYETKSLLVNVLPDKINLTRFIAWVRPNGIAVPEDNDVRRTTRWSSLQNILNPSPTPQTLRPAGVNPMPAAQGNTIVIPDNYGASPYTGSVSPEQQLLGVPASGTVPTPAPGGTTASGTALLVAPSQASTPVPEDVPVIQPPMRTPIASATAPASSPERTANRDFSVKLAEVVEDPLSENGYRIINYFENYVLQKGEQVLIDWAVEGVPTVKIENLSNEAVNASGAEFVYPEKTTNYTLQAEVGNLKKNYTLPLRVAGESDDGEGSGLNCELKANATTLSVPGTIMLTWTGGGNNRVQLLSSTKAESDNAEAEKRREEEAKAAGQPYTKPTNPALSGGVIGDWLQPSGFMRVNVDQQTTFVLNAYDGNGNIICAKSVEIKYNGGVDKLDLKFKIEKIADMDDNKTKTFYLGQTGQFTISLDGYKSGKEPTGSVMITDGDSSCSVTLPKDTCSMQLKHEGWREITALYSGDDTYNKATATDDITVKNKRTLELGITDRDNYKKDGGVSQSYYVVGQDVFYTVKLSKYLKGRIPTGTITVSDGTGTCTVTWPSDDPTCSIKAAKAGEPIRVTAVYSGDDVYEKATAEREIKVLTKRPISFEITKVDGTPVSETPIVKLGNKYIVDTRLFKYDADDPTGTIMITDGISSCTVTLPQASCELEAKKKGELTVKAIYSGDSNYVTKIAEAEINVSEKIKTKLEITYASKKDVTYADLSSILSWKKSEDDTTKPTGTITFTLGDGTTYDQTGPVDADTVTGTCVLTIQTGDFNCDFSTKELSINAKKGEKDGSVLFKVLRMLLANKNADRVRASYSGDENFLPHTSTIKLFDQVQVKTHIKVRAAKKPDEDHANIYGTLYWKAEDNKLHQFPPKGKVKFVIGSGTCTLDLETKELDCQPDVGYVQSEMKTEGGYEQLFFSIENVLLDDKKADRVYLEYGGDGYFLPSTSSKVKYAEQELNMEITKITDKEGDEQTEYSVGEVVRVYAELKPPASDPSIFDKDTPIGVVTITRDGTGTDDERTCSFPYNADNPEENYCELAMPVDLLGQEWITITVEASYDVDPYYFVNNPGDDATIKVNKHGISLKIVKITNTNYHIDDYVTQPYYVIDHDTGSGQDVFVFLSLEDWDPSVEPTGTFTIKDDLGRDLCDSFDWPTLVCSFNVQKFGKIGDLELKAHYGNDNYYVDRDVPGTLSVQNKERTEIIFQKAEKILSELKTADVEFELSYDHTVPDQYSPAPAPEVDETTGPAVNKTVLLTNGTEQCKLDLNALAWVVDTTYPDCGGSISRDGDVYKITGMDIDKDATSITAAYEGNTYFYGSNRTADFTSEAKGDTTVTISDPLKVVTALPKGHAFLTVDFTYDQKMYDRFGRAPSGTFSVKFSNGTGSTSECTMPVDGSGFDCGGLTAEVEMSASGTYGKQYIIKNMGLDDPEYTKVTVTYTGNDIYKESNQAESSLTKEDVPSVQITTAKKTSSKVADVVFTYGSVGSLSQHYRLYWTVRLGSENAAGDDGAYATIDVASAAPEFINGGACESINRTGTSSDPIYTITGWKNTIRANDVMCSAMLISPFFDESELPKARTAFTHDRTPVTVQISDPLRFEATHGFVTIDLQYDYAYQQAFSVWPTGSVTVSITSNFTDTCTISLADGSNDCGGETAALRYYEGNTRIILKNFTINETDTYNNVSVQANYTGVSGDGDDYYMKSNNTGYGTKLENEIREIEVLSAKRRSDGTVGEVVFRLYYATYGSNHKYAILEKYDALQSIMLYSTYKKENDPAYVPPYNPNTTGQGVHHEYYFNRIPHWVAPNTGRETQEQTASYYDTFTVRWWSTVADWTELKDTLGVYVALSSYSLPHPYAAHIPIWKEFTIDDTLTKSSASSSGTSALPVSISVTFGE